LIVSPSCSLLHVPLDLEAESNLLPEVKPFLSFAKQKIMEISAITDGLCCGLNEIENILRDNAEVFEAGKVERLQKNSQVDTRLNAITPEMGKRDSSFARRYELQQQKFVLPILPTTTIGSFPQTKEIREARKLYRSEKISKLQYEQAMRKEISNNIAIQE